MSLAARSNPPWAAFSPGNKMKLTTKIEKTEIDSAVAKAFDYEFTGETIFEVPQMDRPDKDFGIGLIVGASGSGKSTLLSSFGSEEAMEWDSGKSVASHFESSDDATERLSAVGFNSIKNWLQPHHTLSNGQRFRADLARRLKDGCVVDEFTSVVNREAAISCSRSVRRYVDRKGLKNIVFASCHSDIIEWLDPDWVYSADEKAYLPKKQQGTSRSNSVDVPTRNGNGFATITISTQGREAAVSLGSPPLELTQLDLFQQ